MPQKFVSEAVLKNISQIPDFETFSVLDLSCGEGHIISELAKKGCNVKGTHYKKNDYIIQNEELISSLDIIYNIDLHVELPFENESFDLILMTEVLEHLESHIRVIHEVARILKPGGYFIFTTPNQYRIHSRLNFFLTGHHKLIQRKLSWDLSKTDLYANHINLVDFPLISTLLFQGNIKIEKMFITRFKWKHVYLIFLYGLLYPFSFLKIRRSQDPTRHRGELNISKWLRSFPMAFSEQMAFITKKGTQ